MVRAGAVKALALHLLAALLASLAFTASGAVRVPSSGPPAVVAAHGWASSAAVRARHAAGERQVVADRARRGAPPPSLPASRPLVAIAPAAFVRLAAPVSRAERLFAIAPPEANARAPPQA
jgi:hypothetical protein